MSLAITGPPVQCLVDPPSCVLCFQVLGSSRITSGQDSEGDFQVLTVYLNGSTRPDRSKQGSESRRLRKAKPGHRKQAVRFGDLMSLDTLRKSLSFFWIFSNIAKLITFHVRKCLFSSLLDWLFPIWNESFRETLLRAGLNWN